MKNHKQIIVNGTVGLLLVGFIFFFKKTLEFQNEVRRLKNTVKILEKEVQEREKTQTAGHQRNLLKISIKGNQMSLEEHQKLVNALVVIMGNKAKESIMAQGELIRILGLFPYNYPSLSPSNRNAKTIYHRFRSWQGRKGYHFCCIARGPNTKKDSW